MQASENCSSHSLGVDIPTLDPRTNEIDEQKPFHRATDSMSLRWQDPEFRRKALEGRKGRIPRSAYDKAIAAFCAECWIYQEDCGKPDCNLYPFRKAHLRTGKTKSETIRAIRAECKTCLGGADLRSCTSPKCVLYPFWPGRASLQKSHQIEP